MIRTDEINQELDARCLEVLRTYAVRESTAKAIDNPEDSGWLERINAIPGLDAGELTTAHGTLIAEGLLKFEVTGRCLGLQYQLSSLGRQLLSSTSGLRDDDPETSLQHSLADSPVE